MKPLHPLRLGLAVAISSSILYIAQGIFMLVMPSLAFKLKANAMHFASAETLAQFIKVTPMNLATGTVHVFIMSFILGCLIGVFYDCCGKDKK